VTEYWRCINFVIITIDLVAVDNRYENVTLHQTRLELIWVIIPSISLAFIHLSDPD